MSWQRFQSLMERKNFSKDDYRFHGHELAEYGWYDGGLEELQEAVARVGERSKRSLFFSRRS